MGHGRGAKHDASAHDGDLALGGQLGKALLREAARGGDARDGSAARLCQALLGGTRRDDGRALGILRQGRCLEGVCGALGRSPAGCSHSRCRLDGGARGGRGLLRDGGGNLGGSLDGRGRDLGRSSCSGRSELGSGVDCRSGHLGRCLHASGGHPGGSLHRSGSKLGSRLRSSLGAGCGHLGCSLRPCGGDLGAVLERHERHSRCRDNARLDYRLGHLGHRGDGCFRYVSCLMCHDCLLNLGRVSPNTSPPVTAGPAFFQSILPPQCYGSVERPCGFGYGTM